MAYTNGASQEGDARMRDVVHARLESTPAGAQLRHGRLVHQLVEWQNVDRVHRWVKLCEALEPKRQFFHARTKLTPGPVTCLACIAEALR